MSLLHIFYSLSACLFICLLHVLSFLCKGRKEEEEGRGRQEAGSVFEREKPQKGRRRGRKENKTDDSGEGGAMPCLLCVALLLSSLTPRQITQALSLLFSCLAFLLLSVTEEEKNTRKAFKFPTKFGKRREKRRQGGRATDRDLTVHGLLGFMCVAELDIVYDQYGPHSTFAFLL